MVKTNFDKLVKEITVFEIKSGFTQTPKTRLVAWLKKEIKHYLTAKTKSEKANKLADIIVLALQLARRDKLSLDSAWKAWWQKSRKYLIVRKR